MNVLRAAFHADDFRAMADEVRKALEECRKSKERDLTSGVEVTHGDGQGAGDVPFDSGFHPVSAVPIRCIQESIVQGTDGSRTILTGSTHQTGSKIGNIVRVFTRPGPGCPNWDGIWHQVYP